MPLNPIPILFARMAGASLLLWVWSAPRAVWVGFGVFCALVFCLIAFTAYGSDQEMTDRPRAALQALDKATARTHAFTIDIGTTVQIGTLFIRVPACRVAPPMAERPEAAAFVQAWEEPPPTGEPRWVFSGWMFASSPAVSAMDHPVYDVWVTGCPDAQADAPPSD